MMMGFVEKVVQLVVMMLRLSVFFSFFDYDGDDEVVIGNGVDNGSDFSDGSDNEDNSNCGGDDVLVMTMTKTMTTTTTKTKTTTTKMTTMKKTLTRQ